MKPLKRAPNSPSDKRNLAPASGAPQRVRIIGGRWRRQWLPVPDAEGLRPTGDRVRETLFNWLGQDLDGMACFDMFAGAGALGFEAASRGAARVLMCDANPRIARQLRENAARLGAAQVEIRHADALAVAAALPSGLFDVVFVDPPFATDLLAPAMQAAARLLRPGGAIYAECPFALDLHALIGQTPGANMLRDLDIVRSGRAGRVFYHLAMHKSG